MKPLQCCDLYSGSERHRGSHFQGEVPVQNRTRRYSLQNDPIPGVFVDKYARHKVIGKSEIRLGDIDLRMPIKM
jgi:hypothetical protein